MSQVHDEIKQKVYDFVKTIPRGKVVTYSQVVKAAGLKFGTQRLVGKALHENPDPEHIPCHRVVFFDGGLSESYAFGGLSAQKQKLKDEGVKFVLDKVKMSECQWGA